MNEFIAYNKIATLRNYLFHVTREYLCISTVSCSHAWVAKLMR